MSFQLGEVGSRVLIELWELPLPHGASLGVFAFASLTFLCDTPLALQFWIAQQVLEEFLSCRVY